MHEQQLLQRTARACARAQGEKGTPLKQDAKKGKPRSYHEPIPWNYGMLPQARLNPDPNLTLAPILTHDALRW
jgi:hypothetical protein